jgi:2-amino-4-hydroxy-6-hydroxymethyldihydropteridine diphosphokinase
MDRIAYVGVGSNIDAHRNCREGIRRIAEDERVKILALSSLYRTSPVSPVAQDDFLNSVCKIAWHGEALELLSLLESVEQVMARRRDIPLGPRTLDLDILLFEGLILNTPRLTVPHPRLHERKFVLVPCLEIDPGLVHPVLHEPFARLLAGIVDDQRIALFKRLTVKEIRLGKNGFAPSPGSGLSG